MIIGHGHPEVTAAVQAQLERGTTFFANNPQGIELAAAIADAVPCADKVRFERVHLRRDIGDRAVAR